METTAPIVIYVTRDCAYCVRAKNLLKQRGFEYQEVSVDDDPEKRAWLLRTTQRRTVPQIFIHGKSVGGFDELASLDRVGLLEPIVLGTEPVP